jgi:hypothetical protein
MTIRELLDAAKAGDAKAAGRIVEHFRFTHGWSYDDIAAFVRDQRGIDAATWDGLLYEADMMESR